jgi:sulfonate transport system substrate-binding protein
MKLFSKKLLISASAGLLLASSFSAFAETNPTEIRLGVPGAGVGGKPKVGYSFVGSAHLRGVLEEEFKKN